MSELLSPFPVYVLMMGKRRTVDMGWKLEVVAEVNHETIVAIVSIVAMLIIGIAFITILAVFCYKQENIFFKGTQDVSADVMRGKARSRTSWGYRSQSRKKRHKKRKRQGSLRG
jgi:hypothetical protein